MAITTYLNTYSTPFNRVSETAPERQGSSWERTLFLHRIVERVHSLR